MWCHAVIAVPRGTLMQNTAEKRNDGDATPASAEAKPTRERSPGAIRALRVRAKKAQGLKYRGWWRDDRRAKAALSASGRLKPGATEAEVTAALAQVEEDWVERWIGKNRTRDAS